MRRFTFRCKNGHENGVWPDDGKVPAAVECLDCGLKARRRLLPPSPIETPGVIRDVREHFNQSLQMGIRSGRHLKQVQKERGVKDYEKVVEKSTGWK